MTAEVQDLSKAVFASDPISALVPTSQEGGNMRASNMDAMTAPGSVPVDVMQGPGEYFHNDPHVTVSNATAIQPASDGKQQASGQARGYNPAPPAWTSVSSPAVQRKPMTVANPPSDNGT